MQQYLWYNAKKMVHPRGTLHLILLEPGTKAHSLCRPEIEYGSTKNHISSNLLGIHIQYLQNIPIFSCDNKCYLFLVFKQNDTKLTTFVG